MKYIENILEFQDIYGKNFTFLFNGKYKIHNISGIIFSLFFNIFTIIITINFFKYEFFDYYPITFKEVIPYNLSSNKLYIEENTFIFYFSFYKNEKPIDVESILNIDINDEIKQYFIIEKNCTLKYNENISSQYCIYNNKLFYLKEDIFPIKIYLNKTNIILNEFENLKIKIYYSSIYIDIYNYTYPFQKRISSIDLYLDIKIQKLLKGEIKKIGLKSDEGLIFKKNNNFKDHYIIQNKFIEINNINELNNNIFIYEISLSKLSKIIHRKYHKIQEILSIIIAILLLLSLFFIKFLSVYQNKINEYKIINSIFKFYSQKKNKEKNSIFKLYKISDKLNKFNDSSVQNINYIKNYRNNNILNSPLSSNSNKNPLIKSKTYISNEHYNFEKNYQEISGNCSIYKSDKFSNFIYILNLKKLFFFTNKSKQYKRELQIIKKELMKYIDFTKFIKNIFDIGIIKSVLSNSKICENWNQTKKYINIEKLNLLEINSKKYSSNIIKIPIVSKELKNNAIKNRGNSSLFIHLNNKRKFIFNNNLLKIYNKDLKYDMKNAYRYKEEK